ncbi:MAG TPA: ABC transporter ATP-binding protein [Thermodesulfobacteriota bacterium]|nr:ABC transporter ATP-binding protein [Thermodesulfobacteriota bacterium]
MASPLVTVKGLEKYFLTFQHRVEVLKGLDLEIQAGETMAVVGASGSGKSTLLYLLGTLDQPSGGQVFFEGQSLFDRSPQDLARFRNQSIGFVFQFHHLLPEFSAIENAMMPLLIARESKNAALEKAEELLIRLGLGERLRHRIGQLSGGEQQRVAIARALIRAPQLILADEPTGNLDRNTGEKIIELFNQLNREQGITFLMVTHNLDLAGRFQRTVEIIDGQAREVGKK